MKEKDIVDFEKMTEDETGELINEKGERIGCRICHTYEKAYEKFQKEPTLHVEARRFCPVCGNPMDDQEMCVVSEVNYSNPDGNIGYYNVLYCDECHQHYALMPIPISHNANHDIYYTGGRDYIEDRELEKLKNDIFEKIKPSIAQYIDRKLNPKDWHDKSLEIWNINTWVGYDIEHAIANWFYEHNLKK